MISYLLIYHIFSGHSGCLQRDLQLMLDHSCSQTRKHMPLAPVRCCLSTVCAAAALLFCSSLFLFFWDFLSKYWTISWVLIWQSLRNAWISRAKGGQCLLPNSKIFDGFWMNIAGLFPDQHFDFGRSQDETRRQDYCSCRASWTSDERRPQLHTQHHSTFLPQLAHINGQIIIINHQLIIYYSIIMYNHL